MTAPPSPITPGAADAQVGQIFQIAMGLRREGRLGHALSLLQHLATLHPGRTDIRLAYADALGQQGRTLESLAQLNALRQQGPVGETMLKVIQGQAAAAIAKYNLHLQRSETAEAETYAAALAELMPQNTAMLSAAITCNRALGRAPEALRYARLAVALEPENHAARTVLADLLHAVGDIGAEIEHRVALALAPPADQVALITLRDLHDAAGLILCRPLTPESRAQLDRLLAAARALDVPVPAGTEFEAWANHYRSLLDALDMELALSAFPARAEGKLEMMAADGEPLDWKRLKARADGLDARCVFFAAADEAYVDLYARWFALSVRRYADVPFLAVIHVIGGKGALKRVAEKVGVADEGLVFTACDFDPARATTAICDAPPKSWTEKPVAHLQSVRFLRLGALLRRLQRPVFVSDIDLLVQRGVADLLEAHDHRDVVLNENETTFNAGSRLTANLLLVNPTPNGASFVDALAGYLDDRLSRPSVTRWIDQVGLTLARHNLQANAPGARIGYFDTRSDINNLMYPSYQEHPYRFFSLFHGFDTASLERDPRVLGEGEAGA
jgi:tetratricopeptide (TPR) repeat protein